VIASLLEDIEGGLKLSGRALDRGRGARGGCSV